MLVSASEVSKRLNISNRAVQIKCKNANLPKIGNRYQITQAVAELWYLKQETKSEKNKETNIDNSIISLPKQNKPRFVSSQSSYNYYAMVLVFILIAFILYLVHINDVLSNDNKDTIQIHRIEVKGLENDLKIISKKYNDAIDVMHQQELELQYLKIKDSIRKFKD